MSSTKYRRDIDALRGVAVLIVVIYHAFPNLLPGGFVGVDVFFVISGYLITSIISVQLYKDDFSFLDFYQKRVKRIFPALIVVLLSTIILGWLFLFPDEYKQLGTHLFKASFFILNFQLIDELGYFDVSSHYKPLLHFWTLGIEEQYYLFWPLILFILHKLNTNALVFCGFALILSFCANLYFIVEYRDTVFFHTFTRFWEIGLGSFIALVFLKQKQKKYLTSYAARKCVFLIGIGVILCSAILLRNEFLYPNWLALLPTLGAVCVIIADIKLKKTFGLVSLGLISYPLYLWHWVVLSFTYIYIGKEPSDLVLIFAVVLSFLLAYLTQKYIEIIRYSKSHKVTISLCVFVLMVGLVGLLIQSGEGMPDRPHLNYVDKFGLEFQRTPMVDNGCELLLESILGTKRLFDYCRTNSSLGDRRLVAIIGDSHAHALYPGLSKSAANFGYDTVLLANSSCPPLRGFKWGRGDSEKIICAKKIEQILEFLNENQKVDKVVFVTRGPVYIHGEIQGEISESSVAKSLNNFVAPDIRTYQEYANGYLASIESISNMVHIKNLYYYLENPELDFLPKELVPRPFDYFGISIKSNLVRRDLYQLRMQRYRDLILGASKSFSKVLVVDVEPYLCSNNHCSSYLNGNFLYADDDHFSVFGSTYIAEKTEKLLFQSN